MVEKMSLNMNKTYTHRTNVNGSGGFDYSKFPSHSTTNCFAPLTLGDRLMLYHSGPCTFNEQVMSPVATCLGINSTAKVR